MSAEPLTPEQRQANVQVVVDAEKRLVRVRDQLATAAAQIGPLFREVEKIQESLAGVLEALRPEPTPGNPGTLKESAEAVEFEGEGKR